MLNCSNYIPSVPTSKVDGSSLDSCKSFPCTTIAVKKRSCHYPVILIAIIINIIIIVFLKLLTGDYFLVLLVLTAGLCFSLTVLSERPVFTRFKTAPGVLVSPGSGRLIFHREQSANKLLKL